MPSAPIAFLVALYSSYETLKRRNLSPQLPYFFGISFLMMGGGAFAAEWIGFHMPTKVLYGIAMVTEEFCEMLGVSIILTSPIRDFSEHSWVLPADTP